MRQPALAILLLASVSSAAFALPAEEKTSRACEKIYARLCKDTARGPDRLYACSQKHPDLKIPARCEGDYQQKFEGIVDAETANCVSKAQPLCKGVDSKLDGAAYLSACGKANPKLFGKLKPICKRLAGS